MFQYKTRSLLCLLSLYVLINQVKAQTISDKVLKKIHASNYKADAVNEDGVFVAQHSKTKKWGMFQAFSESEIIELIPMNYDSVDYFGFNAKLTGVWVNGKVGIYISPWTYGEGKQTVECLYEDYKIYDIEKQVQDGYGSYRKYFTYVAVKKNGLWAWIDWMSGELKTEFNYDLAVQKMPFPKFEQEN